jgi:hypothetical protein
MTVITNENWMNRRSNGTVTREKICEHGPDERDRQRGQGAVLAGRHVGLQRLQPDRREHLVRDPDHRSAAPPAHLQAGRGKGDPVLHRHRR